MSQEALTLAVVGGRTPRWADSLPRGFAQIAPIASDSLGAVEAGLNQALDLADTPFFLPVQADDRLDPQGLRRWIDYAWRAPQLAAGATAVTDHLRPDGTAQAEPAVALYRPRDLLTRPRTPTPVLMRTGAVRAAGGWRPGEAAWSSRQGRHRGVLARMLQQGPILAADVHVGSVAPPAGVAVAAPTPDDALVPGEVTVPRTALDIIRPFLYRRVRLTGPGLELTGRLAAVGPELITLAAGPEQVVLLKTSEVQSLAVLAEAQAPANSLASAISPANSGWSPTGVSMQMGSR